MKAIIFDFDGTLEDWNRSDPYAHKYLFNRLKHLSHIKSEKTIETIWIKAKSQIKKNIGSSKYSRAEWLYNFFNISHDQIKRKNILELEDKYWNIRKKHVLLYPKVKSTLNFLKKKYKIAMLSDSDGHIKYKKDRLNKFNLKPYFDVIVIGSSLHTNKPEPYLFEYTAKKLKIHPKDCIMVGDDPYRDLKGAKKIGMTTVWIKQGKKQTRYKTTPKYVDFTIKKIEQIKDVAKKFE